MGALLAKLGDPDDFLAFQTPKVVKVKNKKIKQNKINTKTLNDEVTRILPRPTPTRSEEIVYFNNARIVPQTPSTASGASPERERRKAGVALTLRILTITEKKFCGRLQRCRGWCRRDCGRCRRQCGRGRGVRGWGQRRGWCRLRARRRSFFGGVSAVAVVLG